jgi:hypothetical protein
MFTPLLHILNLLRSSLHLYHTLIVVIFIILKLEEEVSDDEGEETIVDSSFTYDPQGQSVGDQQIEEEVEVLEEVEEEAKGSDNEADDGDADDADDDDDDAWMKEV